MDTDGRIGPEQLFGTDTLDICHSFGHLNEDSSADGRHKSGADLVMAASLLWIWRSFPEGLIKPEPCGCAYRSEFVGKPADFEDRHDLCGATEAL